VLNGSGSSPSYCIGSDGKFGTKQKLNQFQSNWSVGVNNKFSPTQHLYCVRKVGLDCRVITIKLFY